MTRVDVATLERQINDLDTQLWDGMDTLSLEKVDELCFKRAQVKFVLHRLVQPGRMRCEHCGAFLAAQPAEQCYTESGDNLDRYHCKRCTCMTEECY